jgi:hypothetical protein
MRTWLLIGMLLAGYEAVNQLLKRFAAGIIGCFQLFVVAGLHVFFNHLAECFD